MKNERRMLPLKLYTLQYRDNFGGEEPKEISFTADQMVSDGEFGVYYFYNTGNVIRVVNDRPSQIIITPVDDADEEE